MEEKYKNNHFIQKAFAKLFCFDKNKIQYIFYGQDKKYTRNINNKNFISIDYYYGAEIEKYIGPLEKAGIELIKKIVEESKKSETNKIIINRA